MSSTHLVVAPQLVALVTAIVALLVRRSKRVQAAISLVGVGAYAVAVAVLASRVLPLSAGDEAATLTYQLSAWEAPFGISMVADPLAAFMLVLTAVLAVVCAVYSVWSVESFGQRVGYHPLFHFMLVGVTGSFLTGDVFNLFVWFEVMLISSYVLVVFYGGPGQTRAALTYVVLNLVGSAFMLVAIGGLYATTGTLNMADMSRRLSNPSAYGVDPAPVLGIGAILFVVFAFKAGLVPLHFWVPAAYRAAPAPVSAMLAGVVKKVGVYAIVRLTFTVFGGATLVDGTAFLSYFGWVLYAMALASILLGGAVALGRVEFDDLLSYSSIGQVGFIALPIALAATTDPAGIVAGFGPVGGGSAPVDPTTAIGPESVAVLGIAAGLVYAINHGLAKGLLFLASGTLRAQAGTSRLDRLGGVVERDAVLSAAVLTGGLALVGIPPLAGFFGKFLVFDAAVRAGADLALGVALVGAVLTILYVTRAWNEGFWGQPSIAAASASRRTDLTALVAVLAVAVLVVGVGFDPVWRAAEAAATAALDRGAYVEAVGPEVYAP